MIRIKRMVAAFIAASIAAGVCALVPQEEHSVMATESAEPALASPLEGICAEGDKPLPAAGYTDDKENVVENDFEVNWDGWYENSENVHLEAVDAVGHDGSRGLVVSARCAETDGATAEKGLYLVGGVAYTYHVWVYCESDATAHLTLQCVDMESEAATTVTLAQESLEAGQWCELCGEYTADLNSGEFALNVWCTQDTATYDDFIIDDVTITQQVSRSEETVLAADSALGLKDEFSNYFRVGNILNSSTVKNSAITANILRDYNSIECENETKPDATLVQSQCSEGNIAVSLANAAAIFDFCVNNNIAVRGHTFVWYSQTPEWFFKEGFDANGDWVSAEVMDARLESYIKNMFAAIAEQYPALNLYAYDVCNECISDDSNRTANYGGAREAGYGNGASPWVQIYGDNSFVEKAFRYARAYAPEGCALYYNDYNEYWSHKRDCIYTMCQDLYEKGLLDGVGMQSHIDANYTGFSGVEGYVTAMQQYLSIGCDVQITELDVSLDGGTYTLEEQAEKYAAIFSAAVDWNTNPQSTGRVTAVCIWGPNDANSWLSAGSDALLYDANNEPKLAYTTLMNLLDESLWGDGSAYDGGTEPNEYGWYFHSPFEGDLDSWCGRGDATIMTSGRCAYLGDEACLVQNRTASWNGVQRTLDTATFKAGETYSFSVHVTYYDGAVTQPFYLKLQYVDESGQTRYDTIAAADGIRGVWVQLSNFFYTIPADASSLVLYVETGENCDNFYIDEAIGAVGGTYIVGEGVPVLILGDVDGSGIIDGIDLTLLRLCRTSGCDSTLQRLAADVDQSGNIDDTDIALLQAYLLGQLCEFPIAEEDNTVSVDNSAMEARFASINLTTSYKAEGENNPLYTQRFGADPGVMEYDGRVYVYTTNDVIEYDSAGNVVENTYALVDKINCISSDDMVNWTDHGAIDVAGEGGVAAWASNSWAPCAAHKTINGKEKFFLYFCNGGNGVCVLTADSPTGPWEDPLGAPLVSRSTTNCADIVWLFDPAVMVDDDGTGYLCFGGGVPDGEYEHPQTARIVRLADDMIHLDGDPVLIDAPYLFEDGGINKIGDMYYYTYCSNWNTAGNSYGMTSGAIEYMVASSPLGPYTYGGEVFVNQGNFFGRWGNNHHSIVELSGQLYFFYHARAVEEAMGIDGNYRSVQVDKMTVNADGSIVPVVGTMEGVEQLHSLNPYALVPAETMANSAGINVRGCGDTVVTDIDRGDWIKVAGVDFAEGCSTITVKASGSGAIRLTTGRADGEVIGYVPIETAGEMSEITVAVARVTGVNDLYFVFDGDIELDAWQFT